jgi:ATP-dependent helicase/DNAse subunit B
LNAYNERITICESVLSTPLRASQLSPVIEIQKTGDALAALREKALKGFSASSLNAYRNCPLRFYFAEIAAIKEPEDVDDTIDAAVLGSAVHEALCRLYKPFMGHPLTKADFSMMEKEMEAAVDKAFEMKFKGSDIAYGENLLLVSVAKLMVRRFLRYDARQHDEIAKSGKHCSVAFLEQMVETTVHIQFEEKDLAIRLKGFIDRVDRMEGSWKIIDYKTGTVDSKNVKVKDWNDLIDKPDLNIGFQLLLYGYLLAKHVKSPESSSAGIISLKRINSGFTAVSVPGDEPGSITSLLNDTTNSRFEEVILDVLKEVYDVTIPFAQTTDLKICKWCPYINLCGR